MILGQKEGSREARERLLDFGVFLSTISLIICITSSTGLLLLAPPYSVTAYLAIFERKSEFSSIEGVVLSYTVVIASTEVLRSLLGTSALVVLVSVFMVSAFVSITRFKHPPAMGLAISSYTISIGVLFIIASGVILGVIVVIHAIVWQAQLKQ